MIVLLEVSIRGMPLRYDIVDTMLSFRD